MYQVNDSNWEMQEHFNQVLPKFERRSLNVKSITFEYYYVIDLNIIMWSFFIKTYIVELNIFRTIVLIYLSGFQ